MGELFETLFNFLKDLLQWCLDFLLGLLIDLVNLIIEAVAGLLAAALALLPSPTFDLSPPAWLVDHAGSIAWFFPLGTLATCIGIAAVAGAAYFPWKMITKFARLQ